MFLKNEFFNRLVQVSLFAALVYYITTYPVVFESARKYFPIKFKKTHHLLIFHTFVFMVLMYVLTYFVFDPIVRVVEGSGNPKINAKDIKVWDFAVGGGNATLLDIAEYTADESKILDTYQCEQQGHGHVTGFGELSRECSHGRGWCYKMSNQKPDTKACYCMNSDNEDVRKKLKAGQPFNVNITVDDIDTSHMAGYKSSFFNIPNAIDKNSKPVKGTYTSGAQLKQCAL